VLRIAQDADIKSKMEWLRTKARPGPSQTMLPPSELVLESQPASANASSKRRSSIFSTRPSTAGSRAVASLPPPSMSRWGLFRSASGAQIPEEVDPHMDRTSRISVADISGPLQPLRNHFGTQATNDNSPYVRRSDDGSIEAGTLEGLVEMLTTDSDVRKDEEYRDIFLISHTAFTSSEAVFTSLVRRYHEVDANTGVHAEYRARVRYNIITVMKHWLASPHVKADIDILSQMKQFVLSVRSSKIMSELAHYVAQTIDARMSSNQDSYLFLSPPSPVENVPVPRPKDISPQGLALALTTLEGDQYSRILPADYISHFRNPLGSDNVSAACATNNKIFYWVKRSVLQPATLEGRAEVFKFFVNTAHECRKLRNFQSTAAIVNALESSSIRRLTMTRKEVADKAKGLLVVLHDLEQLLQPERNHRRYRAALKESPAACIPWTDVHLIELKGIFPLQQIEDVDYDGRRLINFAQCIKFSARMKEILNYKSPNHGSNEVGSFSYLESQLRGIRIGPSLDRFLDSRSRSFGAEEKRIGDLRIKEFKSLGFPE